MWHDRAVRWTIRIPGASRRRERLELSCNAREQSELPGLPWKTKRSRAPSQSTHDRRFVADDENVPTIFNENDIQYQNRKRETAAAATSFVVERSLRYGTVQYFQAKKASCMMIMQYT